MSVVTSSEVVVSLMAICVGTIAKPVTYTCLAIFSWLKPISHFRVHVVSSEFH